MLKFDVLVVGELNVDLIMNQIVSFPKVGKEVLAGAMNLTLGSSSAIFASNLRTLGSSVTFAGKLGRDSFGDHILSSFNARGVDVGNIVTTTDYPTGITVVLNFSEDRANVTYPGAMNHLSLSDISESALQGARHIHVSSIFLQQGIRKDIAKLFKKAKHMGLTTSIDPQWDPFEKWDIDLPDLLPVTDVFMPNATELMAITQTQSLDQALGYIKNFSTVTAIKNGSEGAFLWDGHDMIHQPAFRNHDVVDSIGAGDSFDAGFIHAFLQQNSWKECLQLGALMGAVNTTEPGGTGAFKSLAQIKNIAQSVFNQTL